ncbi:MAG: tRNA pseudouridine(38-40) synthase TruA [Opitutaceae bacterium]|nr:tRNA pseudouridine(38-40) synthase TruA [Opitutaceae bacterium]
MSPKVRRWKCTCAYDGSAFIGWQSQDQKRGVQDIVEARLVDIFGELVRTHASGRTDAGVHARAQVFHFDAAWRHAPDKLLAALRSRLPEQLQIISLRPVSEKFHARFSAKRKRYDYFVQVGDADPFTRPYCWPVFLPLDLAAMRAAAAVLRGRHDFRAFTALNGTPRENTVREVTRLDVVRSGRRIRITAEAPGFLYKMVRSLVGAIVAVGLGKVTPAELAAILESKKRVAAVLTAPPQGLFLTKVFY